MMTELTSEDRNVRMNIWRCGDWTPDPEQIEHGLSDGDCKVRRAVWRRGDWKPTPEQIDKGLADTCFEVRYAVWRRDDWNLTPKQTEGGLSIPGLQAEFWNKYAIIQLRYWYGSPVTRTLLTNGIRVYVWPTCDQAHKWVIQEMKGDYYLSSNECSRPQYQIVETGSQRFLRAYRMTFGGAEYRRDKDCVPAEYMYM